VGNERLVLVENMTDVEVLCVILESEMYCERTIEEIKSQLDNFSENYEGYTFDVPHEYNMNTKMRKRINWIQRIFRRL
jgi:hypothetical protein